MLKQKRRVQFRGVANFENEKLNPTQFCRIWHVFFYSLENIQALTMDFRKHS